MPCDAHVMPKVINIGAAKNTLNNVSDRYVIKNFTPKIIDERIGSDSRS